MVALRDHITAHNVGTNQISHCELPGSVPAQSAQLPQLPCETPHLACQALVRVASITRPHPTASSLHERARHPDLIDD